MTNSKRLIPIDYYDWATKPARCHPGCSPYWPDSAFRRCAWRPGIWVSRWRHSAFPPTRTPSDIYCGVGGDGRDSRAAKISGVGNLTRSYVRFFINRTIALRRHSAITIQLTGMHGSANLGHAYGNNIQRCIRRLARELADERRQNDKRMVIREPNSKISSCFPGSKV